jgi:predicted PurR-regulated permease PerM
MSPPAPPPAVDSRVVWRVLVLVFAAIALFLFGQFVLEDGGSILFILLMSWFASIAMEPAVSRLSQHMKRGLATGLVMLSVALATLVFFLLFGGLLADQLVQLVRGLPSAIEELITWINQRFDTNLDPLELLQQAGLGPGDVANITADLAAGVLAVLFAAVGAFFSLFTFALFTFYFSADAPRLAHWVAGLLPPTRQSAFDTALTLAVEKTGGYVAARVVLATINGATTALFLFLIGMPYALPLGIWTGVVAQFVPTIGTYIAIALPVLIGLLSADPKDGLFALAWGIGYQQVENLTLEPRISARAVNVHPAVSFASVMLGASLFGVAGALLAVPVAALLLALFEIYTKRYEVLVDYYAEPDAGSGLRSKRGKSDGPPAEAEPAQSPDPAAAEA